MIVLNFLRCHVDAGYYLVKLNKLHDVCCGCFVTELFIGVRECTLPARFVSDLKCCGNCLRGYMIMHVQLLGFERSAAF